MEGYILLCISNKLSDFSGNFGINACIITMMFNFIDSNA